MSPLPVTSRDAKDRVRLYLERNGTMAKTKYNVDQVRAALAGNECNVYNSQASVLDSNYPSGNCDLSMAVNTVLTANNISRQLNVWGWTVLGRMLGAFLLVVVVMSSAIAKNCYYYDKNGNRIGSCSMHGNETTYYDKNGNMTGSSHEAPSEIRHYNRNGQYEGSTKP